MSRKMLDRIGVVAAIGIVLACDGQGEVPMRETDADMPAGQQMEGMGGTQGMGEMGMMQRHAEELVETTDRLRQHVRQMRQRSPEEQHERMGEHVVQLSRMLGLMNRQMREMDMGMGMSDEQMGEMMGTTGEEHRQMMDSLEALRAEVEQLQTASLAEVRQRMPGHLDRLEETTRMLEASAAAMRGM